MGGGGCGKGGPGDNAFLSKVVKHGGKPAGLSCSISGAKVRTAHFPLSRQRCVCLLHKPYFTVNSTVSPSWLAVFVIACSVGQVSVECKAGDTVYVNADLAKCFLHSSVTKLPAPPIEVVCK